MNAREIAEQAEKHRRITPGMGNWQTLINDAWVLLRNLAEIVATLEDKVNGGDTGQPK